MTPLIQYVSTRTVVLHKYNKTRRQDVWGFTAGSLKLHHTTRTLPFSLIDVEIIPYILLVLTQSNTK